MNNWNHVVQKLNTFRCYRTPVKSRQHRIKTQVRQLAKEDPTAALAFLKGHNAYRLDQLERRA